MMHKADAMGSEELTQLRRHAEELAEGQRRTVSTAHLLAAVAMGKGAGADVLLSRRLDADTLLRGARIATDENPRAILDALNSARDFSRRSAEKGSPKGLHLLFALCNDAKSGAHRALVQCGVDVAKLRGVVVQTAMGLCPVPRPAADMRHERSNSGSPSGLRGTAIAVMDKPGAGLPGAGKSTSQRILPTPPTKPAPTPAAKTPAAKSGVRIPVAAPVAAPAKAKKAGKPQGKAQDRFALDPKRQPLLSKLGVNLTQMAAMGTLEVTMPREEITESILDVLAKRKGNSACLLGDAGVGKTSMVRALASHIASDSELSEIDERIVIELSMSKLMAGTSMRGSLAERVAEVRAEVKKSGGRIVIFFDDVHELFGADAQEAAAELKSAMEQGEITCIGATSPEAFRRMVEADGGLSRMFSTILVEEMSPEEAFLALKETAPLLGEHHKAELSDEVIAAAVGMTKRYMPEARLPDKALRVLDLACARTRRRSEGVVSMDRLAQAVSELCDVPVERLLGSDGERMLALEKTLAERVVGHTSALERIARVLRRSASGFRWKRPIGTFLMLGPTGVGKTETAKAIAECLFDSEHAMTRLDMSEFAEAHTISRLLGAPPGYVGHEAGGQLTEAVRKRPYQVVLLDEIEKANRDVLEAFLQVFDEGRLTDGRGRTVDFTNTVILMTSNLGVAEASHAGKRTRIGFSGGDTGTQHKAFEDALLGAARKDLPPELYNRIDEVIAMSSLSRSDVAEVARRMLKQLGAELGRSRGVRLDVGEEAIAALLDQGGYDPEMGARPMRRTIGRLVEAPIAEMLLRGELDRGDVALLYVDDGKLGVDIVSREDDAARGAAE